MNLYQKLKAIRKSVPYLKKDSRGHFRAFVDENTVIAALEEKMDELGVEIFTSMTGDTIVEANTNQTMLDGKTRNEGIVITKTNFEFTVVDIDTGETHLAKWYCDNISKAGDIGMFSTGKCATYGNRYFLLKFFRIPTGHDDPELHKQKKETIKESVAEKAIPQQVERLKKLATNPLATQKMHDDIKSKVKGGLTAKQADDLIKKAEGVLNRLESEKPKEGKPKEEKPKTKEQKTIDILDEVF